MAQHTDARHTDERHTDDRRSRERGPIMHRTAPEAAPMVVGHAPAPASRRSTAVGIAMLVIGVAAVIGALIALGARIFPAFRAVRDTALDPAAVFFMGTSGSVGELVLVIALMALVPTTGRRSRRCTSRTPRTPSSTTCPRAAAACSRVTAAAAAVTASRVGPALPTDG